ncbi:MAG: hypothetical protein ACRBN8_38820 [Nannocystales bacterium]
MRPFRISLGAAVGLVLALLATGCGAQDCGCGASPDDAFAEHDLSYPGEHDLTNECACRCADGPVQPIPLDDEGGCEYAGAECIDDEGYPAELVCSG